MVVMLITILKFTDMKIFIKLIVFTAAASALFFVASCYSSKSMGDTQKADKYLFVY